MSKHIPAFILGSALAVILASCGGGDGSFAGIGGTGVASRGVITGFGSIFVNGIEFETQAASVVVDGAPASDQDLALGMVVTVRGTLNSDGITATADAVEYDDEVQGPIDADPVEDMNAGTKTFTVLGVTVIATDGVTVFEAEDGSPFGYDTLAQGQLVEVSGFYDANGDLQATRIEEKDPAPGEAQFEIKGYVANHNPETMTFDLELTPAPGISRIRYDERTDLSDLPNGLQDGLYVEVKGDIDPLDNSRILASRIEQDDDGFGDVGGDEEVHVEGIVSGFTDLSATFFVAGQEVDAGSAEFEPASLRDTIADGMQVEVEGHLVDTVLVAEQVEGRGGSESEGIEIASTVADVDAVASTITVNGSAADTVTVQVDARTLMQDDRDGDVPLTLDQILAGDYLEIRAIETDTGALLATHVERKQESKQRIELRGPMQDEDELLAILTLLGVSFETGPATVFRICESPVDANQFFARANVGDPIKVRDDTGADGLGDGTAEEVDLEAGCAGEDD